MEICAVEMHQKLLYETRDKLPFLDLEPLFFWPGLASHPRRLCRRSGTVSPAALRTVPQSQSPDRSARFQSVRNSSERVTLEMTAPITAATFGPSAEGGRSSDTHGCTRRKLGLQRLAAPGLTATSRRPNLPSVGDIHSLCAWCSQSQPVPAPVPRSAASWSADLPPTGSSRSPLSSRTLPVLFFQNKILISCIVYNSWCKTCPKSKTQLKIRTNITTKIIFN